MKYMITTMPDGSKWRVPAETIAEHRARHYENQGYSYDEEFLAAMNDLEELEDWAENNMDWQDVRSIARRQQEAPEMDWQEGWVNGPKEWLEE